MIIFSVVAKLAICDNSTNSIINSTNDTSDATENTSSVEVSFIVGTALAFSVLVVIICACQRLGLCKKVQNNFTHISRKSKLKKKSKAKFIELKEEIGNENNDNSNNNNQISDPSNDNTINETDEIMDTHVADSNDAHM